MSAQQRALFEETMAEDEDIPTIQDLGRKGVRELHAIFHSAADNSANTKLTQAERTAARKTQDNILRVLAAHHPRP
ncbi:MULTISPECIES: hypothetical protein [Ramlibacter]|uniref:Uncharacterized protein n=1 Tax=Ramlibacter aquaticus TaxID=2780094 RepID=A0ABR9SIV7_9BURK|nr:MULTISPECIES: hypothetical protein [Ramlibacter]MBE7942267.1 hypothetical protein [Ramlibacter aquaticus]